MPRIKITGGPPHITRVSIGDEEVTKNTDVEVSDEFVARLEKEFPELTCETLEAEKKPESTGTGSGGPTDPSKDPDPNNNPNKTEPSGQQGLGGVGSSAPGRTGVNE